MLLIENGYKNYQLLYMAHISSLTEEPCRCDGEATSCMKYGHVK